MNDTPPNPIRRTAIRVLSALIGVGVALAIAEVGLSVWSARVARSDQIDPGLIQRDPILGWRLTPGWTGQHTHQDFSVRYTIGPDGFRLDPHARPRTNGWIAVVGDSFAFGLGVQDDQTFCSQLNQQSTGTYANFGIPGYSTDQELLLVEREILRKKPDEILLVVYLGNDLIDNLRPVPLQVSAPKPRFQRNETNLVLQPPGDSNTAQAISSDDATVDILGVDASRGWRPLLSRYSTVFRFLESRIPANDLAPEFPERLNGSLDLFGALLTRMKEDCERNGVRLRLVLLGSATLAHAPRSPTGQYQEFLRHRLTSMAHAIKVPVIDTAPTVAARRQPSGRNELLYHPNEGHLTPAGHRQIAEAIQGGIRSPSPDTE